MSIIKQIKSLFKKAESGISSVPIDYNLIDNWKAYARQLGLTDTEMLGMAYFNSAIPTVPSAFTLILVIP